MRQGQKKHKIQVVIVGPSPPGDVNGNAQTARRWQRLLGAHHAVRATTHWPDAQAHSDQVMLALHARKSAPSIAAWARQHPGHGLAVVLTGTDLYRDVAVDASAQQSLALAQQLVVLNALGPQALPAAWRHKARVVLQSVGARAAVPAKTLRHLRAVVVGHLREEKDPHTVWAAVQLAAAAGGGMGGTGGVSGGWCIDHMGHALVPALGAAAQRVQQQAPSRYRWLGGLPHATVRQRMARAHVLVHPSRMEGGAHVVMEAICSGTPVLASRIDGNVGLLGPDYEGYFSPGDAAGLRALLDATRASQGQPNGLLARLGQQCAARAPLFHPAAEQQALLTLVAHLAQFAPLAGHAAAGAVQAPPTPAA